MSRPRIALTETQKAEVETLAAVLSIKQIADYFGIGRSTFQRLRERDPDLDARYNRGKARAVGSIAQSLIQKARAGDTACMIFYLKSQAGWRETTRVEAAPPRPEAEGAGIDLSLVSTAALRELANARQRKPEVLEIVACDMTGDIEADER